ncbi:hypothetical protein LDL08_07515 [Nonomuraea glycinis]|uniref:Uncharacterized protein n=1 Tax=Nonomuraea glycinis TaxID=2047744 RepID=A0A918E4H4_9ACTN|nr:hypothetical protein [Nonomuraea glycinis]MCA2176024.1 hypothetical protein [Nonomuraea glycinis]GGP05853.1 hypothetical protein GCM10012278_27140 [Nonomuraea glycinis]
MSSRAAPTAIEVAIDNALEVADRDDAARRTKHVIAEELQRFDRRLGIRSTTYFTHNYIPDLVIDWREGGIAKQRQVFLRFHLDTPDVAADMAAAAADAPMFVALRRETEPPEQLPEGDDATLITQVTALEEIAQPSITAQSLGRMVAGSLIRGGKGVMLDEQATSVSAIASNSMDALLAGNVATTAMAVSTFGNFLSEDHSHRLNRFMQLMWRSHGHELEDFPGDDALDGSLSDTEARELLAELFESPSLEDPPFWRRLGGLLSLEQLESFVNIAPNPNLDNLVTANLDRFRGLILALENRPPELFDVELPRWRVSERSLALEADGFHVLLASDRRRFGQVKSTHRMPAWSDLEPRLEAYRVQHLTLLGPTAQVEVKVEQGRNLLLDADITGLSSAVHEEMQVSRVTLVDRGGELRAEADLGKWVMDAGDQGAPVGKLASLGLSR